MRQSKPAIPDMRTPAASQLLTSRRALLAGLPALGVGAGLAAGLAGTDADGSAAQKNPHEPQYSETEHIRTYYAVART